jgi:hypothetical protein
MSIVVFLLTLAFLMRDRILVGAHEGSQAQRAVAVAPAATDVPSAPPAAPMVAPAVQPAVQKTDMPIAPVVADVPAEGDAPVAAAETPQPVPVTLVFHVGEGRDPKEARLQNLANSPLSVSITATEHASGVESVVQVTIPAHRRADLLAAGLSIHAGDAVRVTSASYTDVVLTAQ